MVKKWTDFEKEALEVCFQVVACTCQPHSSYNCILHHFKTVLSCPTVRVQRYEEHSLIVQFYCREKLVILGENLIATFHSLLYRHLLHVCITRLVSRIQRLFCQLLHFVKIYYLYFFLLHVLRFPLFSALFSRVRLRFIFSTYSQPFNNFHSLGA